MSADIKTIKQKGNQGAACEPKGGGRNLGAPVDGAGLLQQCLPGLKRR